VLVAKENGRKLTLTCLFTGWLICLCGAEVINIPLNHSVIFVQEANVVMTSSYCKVIVNFNLTTYEDAIAVLRSELAEVEDVGLTLQIEELHRVQKVIDSLDDKLTNLKQFLPKPERKRGVINMGGSLLKVLFGTATVADLAGLHTTVDKARIKKQWCMQ
jgi:hypothetical protein